METGHSCYFCGNPATSQLEACDNCWMALNSEYTEMSRQYSEFLMKSSESKYIPSEGITLVLIDSGRNRGGRPRKY